MSLPSTPLLYAFVESGHAEPRPGMPDWLCSHHAGPPGGGGGVSLFYHASCPVSPLPLHTVKFPPPPPPPPAPPPPQPLNPSPESTAMTWHVVRPAGRAPLLLAAVYLAPHHATKIDYVLQIVRSLDSVPQQLNLPVLVVGDFNLRHTAWHQPPFNSSAGGPANLLADWIQDNDFIIANQPDMHTHFVHRANGLSSASIIDLVLASDPVLVEAMSTTTPSVAAIASDHSPITITMRLARRPAPSARADSPAPRLGSQEGP